jgi:hypothetical protein
MSRFKPGQIVRVIESFTYTGGSPVKNGELLVVKDISTNREINGSMGLQTDELISLKYLKTAEPVIGGYGLNGDCSYVPSYRVSPL